MKFVHIADMHFDIPFTSLNTVENLGDNYNPILSDDVKGELNTEYFDNNKMEFIKLWAKLLIKYPKDYVESFISNSYGLHFLHGT